jgi:poly(3-hydroxybutyrate) depolymerase
MNLRSLFVVSGMSAILFGACKLNMNLNENYSETKCSGYLGCSSAQTIGLADAGAASMMSGSDAGVTGVLATPGTINAVVKSPGCGKALPTGTPATVIGKATGYKQYMVQGTGSTLTGIIQAKIGPRTFWVRVPRDYDQDKPYRLVYIGQGCGSYNSANTSTLQLFSEAQGGNEEVIYVAIDLPTDMVNMDCYDNRDGPSSQEWEAFQLFQDVIDPLYCFDENRIYISGYSTGGWLSDMWGCYFAGDGQKPWNGVVPASGITETTSALSSSGGADASMSMSIDAASSGAGGDTGPSDAAVDTPPFVPAPGARMFAPKFHIRGQAAVSGGEPPNNPPCNGPVAGIWIHDAGDTSNPLSGSQSALARVLKMNGCVNSKTAPWHPENPLFKSVCVQYTDCPADYPVVFCTTNGEGHMDDHERAIPAFNLFMNLLNPL